MCLDTKDNFENVIWTDESSVQLRRHSQTMRMKIGRERELKPQAKHSSKVDSKSTPSHFQLLLLSPILPPHWIPL